MIDPRKQNMYFLFNAKRLHQTRAGVQQGTTGYNRVQQGTTGTGVQQGPGYNRDRGTTGTGVQQGPGYNRGRGTTGYNRGRGTTGAGVQQGPGYNRVQQGPGYKGAAYMINRIQIRK